MTTTVPSGIASRSGAGSTYDERRRKSNSASLAMRPQGNSHAGRLLRFNNATLALFASDNVIRRHIINRVTIPKFEDRWDRLSMIERNSKSIGRRRHGNGAARRLLVRLE